jgi:hypothetical protein
LKRVRRSFEQEKEKEDFMTDTSRNWIMILYTQSTNRPLTGGGGEVERCNGVYLIAIMEEHNVWMLGYIYVYKYHDFSSTSSISLSRYLALRCLFKLMVFQYYSWVQDRLFLGAGSLSPV